MAAAVPPTWKLRRGRWVAAPAQLPQPQRTATDWSEEPRRPLIDWGTSREAERCDLDEAPFGATPERESRGSGGGSSSSSSRPLSLGARTLPESSGSSVASLSAAPSMEELREAAGKLRAAVKEFCAEDVLDLMQAEMALVERCPDGEELNDLHSGPRLAYPKLMSRYYVDRPMVLVPSTSLDQGPLEDFAVAPQLPSGVRLDATTGVILGIPTEVTPRTTWFVVARSEEEEMVLAKLTFQVQRAKLDSPLLEDSRAEAEGADSH